MVSWFRGFVVSWFRLGYPTFIRLSEIRLNSPMPNPTVVLTNESTCDLSLVIAQLKLPILSLVQNLDGFQTMVGFGNLVSSILGKSEH